MSQIPQPQVVTGQPPSTAISAADVWRIVRKRLWLILACALVIGAGGTGGFVAWYFLAPFYTATSIIEVEPGQGQAGGRADFTQLYSENIPYQLYEQYVMAQVMAIRSDRVLTAALDSLGAAQSMFRGPGAVMVLGEELRIEYVPGTQNITISLTGMQAKQIADIVREVAMQYLTEVQNQRQQVDADRQRDLRTEQEDLRRKMERTSSELAELRRQSDAVVLDARYSEELAAVTTVTRQLADVQFQLASARAAWLQFQELQKEAEEKRDLRPVLLAFPEMMDSLRTDPRVLGLSQQIGRASQDYEGLKSRFGERHDAVQSTKATLEGLQNELQTQQVAVLAELVQQQAAVLKTAYDRAREAEAELLDKVAESRAKAIQLAQNADAYAKKGEEYRRSQELYYTVTDGLERMRITSALTRPNIRIVQLPTIPTEPTEPKVILYSLAVIVFSLFVGVGVSFALEFIDTRLRMPAEVVRQVGVPLLGSIPDLSEDERLPLDTDLALVSHREPESLLAEAFRQFRTNLQFTSDQPIKSVLVTSPSPGDGKSTTAANLAIATARGGGKVLLVEANFRRPALARIFDVPDAIGLSNVLVGMNTAAEAVQATSIENLDILVGGATPPSPAELLGSETMARFIQEQENAYDLVIVDGPPILVVADCHLLAQIVRGVVLVFRANENTRGLAQRAVRTALGLKTHLLGALLNAVRATKGGYFREAYQAYYDYAGTTSAAIARPAAARPETPDTDRGEQRS